MALKDITSILPRSLDSFFFHNPPGSCPYNGPQGKAPPGRVTVFRLQVYEKVGDFTC